MPPQAYALVSLFLLCSVLVGILAVRLIALAGGPRGWPAHVLPVAGGFLAFYLVGHRFGISVGPEITLFGFQVALLGDVLIGFTAALLTAIAQAMIVRSRRGGAAGQPS
jgi:hypothetical protein